MNELYDKVRTKGGHLQSGRAKYLRFVVTNKHVVLQIYFSIYAHVF